MSSTRPNQESPEVVFRTMCVLADIIIKWDDDEYDTDDREYLLEQIEEVFDHLNLWADAYDLAKELEDELAIYPNAELVEALGDLFYERDRIIKELEAKWVEENQIKPNLELGLEIKYPSEDKIQDFTLENVDLKQGKYYLKYHEKPNTRLILDFETLEDYLDEN